jgi:23S rRNA G2445 N2-methylase RlmL
MRASLYNTNCRYSYRISDRIVEGKIPLENNDKIYIKLIVWKKLIFHRMEIILGAFEVTSFKTKIRLRTRILK